ncbi:MAG TPA: c-type cytochrome [Terriglobales bacterium]|nr:c-type cytochrome [Terriglobales bacterium]
MRHLILLIGALFAGGVIISCSHEDRILRQPPQASQVLNTVQVSGINPGNNPVNTPPPSMYSESAYAVSQGQFLYNQYNCVGCHSHGGGGMGPPLMDNYWIYGSSPQNIFASIMQGRPNGMPAWRNRIPEYQAWEIVAYVRSLSGLLSPYVEPGRSDSMNYKASPSSMGRQTPTGITGKPEKKKP